MKKKNPKIMVSIWLAPNKIEFIDDIAQRTHLTRSNIIHNIIEVGYDELYSQTNIGLIKLNLLLRKLKQSIKPILTEAEKQIIVDEEGTKKDSVSIRMDSDLIKKIDLLSAKIGLTRKSFIEYVLEFETREIKRLLSIPGFLEATRTIRDIQDTIRRNWKNNFQKTQEILETKTIDLKDSSENGSE